MLREGNSARRDSPPMWRSKSITWGGGGGAILAESVEEDCLPYPRASWQGNPAAYSTFIDEGINLAIRTCAAGSHRATLERNVFTCFAVMAQLGANTHLYYPAPSDPDQPIHGPG
jgi:hypothetical protein